MFTISVETHFRASHQVVLPDEAKEPLHEHDWQVRADVSSARLNNIGMVMDFVRLKSMLDKILQDICGAGLLETSFFRKNGSSAELVAQYIYQQLEPELEADVELAGIRVVESAGCMAKFTK
ncbi:6-pyruvoyl tetrahydropterin synthase family protein [Planctomycetota bacterium]